MSARNKIILAILVLMAGQVFSQQFYFPNQVPLGSASVTSVRDSSGWYRFGNYTKLTNSTSTVAKNFLIDMSGAQPVMNWYASDGDVTSFTVGTSDQMIWSGAGGGYSYSNGGIFLGSATGGNKGAGTINATALYDDNIQLIAPPFDSSHVANGGLTGADIRDAAVGATQLAPTAVTAGSYTNTSLTVDADGRITAAANGASGVANPLTLVRNESTDKDTIIVDAEGATGGWYLRFSDSGTLFGGIDSTGAPSFRGTGTTSERFGRATTAGGTNSLAMGSTASVGASATSSIAIGAGSSISASAIGSTAIGTAASITSNSCVAIGTSAATTNTQSVAVGQSASATSNGVAIGQAAVVQGSDGVVIGKSAASGSTNNVVVVGSSATSGGWNDNVVIGKSASGASGASSVVLGSGAANTAANQFVVGSNSFPIATVLIGSGDTDASPDAVTYRIANGTGTNIAGALWTFTGSRATGNAASGGIALQTGQTGSTGTTLQTARTRVHIGVDGTSSTAPTDSLFNAVGGHFNRGLKVDGEASVKQHNIQDTTGVVLSAPGAATVSVSNLKLDTFASAALDTAVTLTGTIGDIIYISTRAATRDITFLDSGNFQLGAERLLDDPQDVLVLMAVTTTVWKEISFSNNN